MCGRFSQTTPLDALARLFGAVPDNDLPPRPRWNICPTETVEVIDSQAGQRRLRAMRWGFLPHWYRTPAGGPLLINARAESIAEKPAFREACRARRCLIPATGFFEWTRDAADQRLPWYIHPTEGQPLAFAGVWQVWERPEARHVTCAIVTCAANPQMAALHHRMPVILAPQDWALWLGEAGHGAARLMRPAPEGALAFHRVGPAVNANRAEGPELIAPLLA